MPGDGRGTFSHCIVKLDIVFLAFLLLILHVIPVMAQTCQPDGDVNGDRILTPVDARQAFLHFLGIAELNDCEQIRANVDRSASSSITPGDALCIFQQFLGLPSCFAAQPSSARGSVEVMGNTQPAPPGTVLDVPFVVRVEDEFENPVAGVDVTVTVRGEGAEVAALAAAAAQGSPRTFQPAQVGNTATAQTDAQGEARFLISGPIGTEDITAEVTVLEQTIVVPIVSGGILLPNPNNASPLVTVPAAQTATQGGTVAFDIIASDPDTDTLIFSAASLPPGLSIDPSSGRIGGTVDATAAPGQYLATVTVSDGTAMTSVPFNVIVTTGNNAPDNVAGRVVHFVTDSGVESVDLSFSDSNGRVVGQTQSDASGSYSLTLPVGTIMGIASREGFIPTTVDFAVLPDTTTIVPVIELVSAPVAPGDISGTIRNSVTLEGIDGVTVTLREGVNNTTDPTVATAVTDSVGVYAFTGIPAGTYTATLSRNGFRPSTFTVGVVGGTGTQRQDGSISPDLASGQVRIELQWGETPTDLDTHLTGPRPVGAPNPFGNSCASDPERFHLFFPCSGSSSSPFPEDFSLDVDDTSGFGPETVTINAPLEAGIYRYSVHDFSNLGSSTSTALSTSGARVRVFIGGREEPLTFNVPPDRQGTVWRVFELDGLTGNITPINEFSFESNPGNINSF